MGFWIQYHNLDANRGYLPYEAKEGIEGRLNVETSLDKACDAIGDTVFLIVGFGEPRQYILWARFSCTDVQPSCHPEYKWTVCGNGWTLVRVAGNQKLLNKQPGFAEFLEFWRRPHGLCFKEISDSPFVNTILNLSDKYKPKSNSLSPSTPVKSKVKQRSDDRKTSQDFGQSTNSGMDDYAILSNQSTPSDPEVSNPSDARELVSAKTKTSRSNQKPISNPDSSSPDSFPNISEEVDSKYIGGFGNSEHNKEVEKSSINAVKNYYENNGWEVESVEYLKWGYDLICEKEDQQECVEVKGVSGDKVQFFITRREAEEAENNPAFVLWVVTSALEKPTLRRYTGREFLNKFELVIKTYQAVLKDA